MSNANLNRLPEVERTVVSTYILSEDDLMLMGMQDPSTGMWPGVWRILGGGKKEGETDQETALREANQEAVGLGLEERMLTRLPMVRHTEAEKTLRNGDRVWQKTELIHFAAQLGGLASDFVFHPGGDIMSLQWFDRVQRTYIPLIPGGRELMLEAGFIDRLP